MVSPDCKLKGINKGRTISKENFIVFGLFYSFKKYELSVFFFSLNVRFYLMAILFKMTFCSRWLQQRSLLNGGIYRKLQLYFEHEFPFTVR